jgi:hypothetical protein
MDRERFLIAFGVDANRWAARYGIEPFSHPCIECGAALTTTLPFAQGTLRGLVAPQCECGNKNTPYELVRDPAYGDLFTGTEAQDPRIRVARRTADRARRW